MGNRASSRIVRRWARGGAWLRGHESHVWLSCQRRRPVQASDYLASRGFEPDAVVLAERFPARGTPSLLAVDAEGSLTHMWAGLLDTGQEAEVLDVLFP